MNTDKKTGQNIAVGVLATLGFVALVFFIFTVGDGRGVLGSQYILYTRFSDVKGLHYGSEVSLSGLRIGVVKQIMVGAGESKELVIKLAIDRKIQERICEDSLAIIRTQGVLGDKYIEITIGSPSKPFLKDGAFVRSGEVGDLASKSGALMDEISRHFNKGGNIDALIHNLNRVATNLASLTSDIRNEKGILTEMIYGHSGDKLEKSLAHLEGILKKVQSGEGTLGALVNDPTLYEDMKLLLGGAKRSTVLKYFLNQLIDSGEKGSKK